MHKNSRVRTTPVVEDLKDISIKVRGIVIINQSTKTKSSIIEVKPEQKILYHCYRRYKSFIFPLDCIYDRNQFYSEKLQCGNVVETIEKKYNYCLLCSGSKNSGLQQFCEGNTSKEGLFYLMLSPLFNRFVKKQIMSLHLNFFAVNEDMVLDLVSQKTVDVREGNDEISFHKAQSIQILSLYQLYNSIKNFYGLRKNNIPQSYFVLYGQLQQKGQRNAPKKKVLMVQIPNDIGKVQNQGKAWNSNSLMIINQCLSSLSNRLSHKSKQFHAPFRNSKITRILKPFLNYNTKVDAIGVINSQEMDPTYQTLSFVKNMGKVRVPCSETQNNEEYKRLYEKLLSHTQSKDQIGSSGKKRQLRVIEETGKEELNLRKQLHKLRNNLKMLEEDSLLSFNNIIINNPEDMSFSKSLEDEELEVIGLREKKIIKELEEVKKKRLEAIANTETKTQKLQMMKKYYSLEIENQEEEMKEREEEMQKIKKVYQKRIKTLNDELKKKPKELISQNTSSVKISEQAKKRSESLQIGSFAKQQKLPSISKYNKNKKTVMLKNKVRKGRVELKEFFEENISKYQNY